MNKRFTGLVALLFGLTAVSIAQPSKRAQESAYYESDYKHAADFMGNKDGKASYEEEEVVREAIFMARQAKTKTSYVPWIIVNDTARLIRPYIPENSVPDPKFSPVMVILEDNRYGPYKVDGPRYRGFDVEAMEERKNMGQAAPGGLKAWGQEDLINKYGLYEINLNGQLTGIFKLTSTGYQRINIDTYKNKPLLPP